MKRRGAVSCVLTLSIAAIAATTVYYANKPKSLIDYATRVADASDWQSTNVENPGIVEFCWLSPVEVLYAGADEGGKFRLMKRRIDRPNEPPVSIPITLPLGAQNWQLSPSSQAISYDLWKVIPRITGRAFTIQGTQMSTLDGKASRPVSIEGGYRVWAADSASVFSQGAPQSTTIRQTFLATGKTRVIGLPISLTGRNPGVGRITWYCLLDEQLRRRLLAFGHRPSYYRKRPIPAMTNEPNDSIRFADFHINNPKLTFRQKGNGS